MRKIDARIYVAVSGLVLWLAAVFVAAHGQSLSVGGDMATKIAASLSDCPTVTSGYRLCPVVTASGQAYLAMSVAGYNGGAPFQIVAPPQTFTATATNLPAGSSPTVSVAGNAFAFGIPAGQAGAPGTSPTVSVGTVATLSSGSSATVTNSGTSSAAIFNFSIPQGIPGPVQSFNTNSCKTVNGGSTGWVETGCTQTTP